MTRLEEIRKASIKYSPDIADRRLGFIEGAMWADKAMLDKACEWLKNKVDDEVLFKCGSVIMVLTVDELTKEFSKALDE